MGFFRGTGLFIVGFLLVLSLLAGNLLFTLSMSLEYENVQPEIASSFNDIISGEFSVLENQGFDLTKEVEEGFGVMEEYCLNNDVEDYIFNEQGFTFVVSCDTINKGIDAVVSEGLENSVEDLYYREYNCDFWECLKESEYPFFLISEKSQNYFEDKFYLFLFISIVLLVLLFFFVETKQNFFILSGGAFVLVALPFMKLGLFFSLFGETITQFAGVFVSQSYTVFLGSLFLGILLLGVGIGWHFFNFGNFVGEKIEEISSKVKESMPKPEKKR